MDARRWMVILGLLLLIAGFSAQAATSLQWTAAPNSDSGWGVDFAAGGNPKHRAALDSAGNLFVAGGNCENPPGSSSCGTEGHFVAKYAVDTGAELWRRTTSPAETGLLQAVAVDASGNAYVVGAVQDETNSNVYQYVAKLSGADGSTLWEVVGAPGQGTTTTSGAGDVVLDAAGNPYVLAVRDGMTIVTRYGAADGSITWSSAPAYDAAGDQIDLAIGIDPDGDILGFTYVDGGHSSMLFKLTGNTGERVWGTPLAYRINIPGGFDIRAFTLDGAGKPIIAGYDISKYSNADGSSIWARPIDPCCTSSNEIIHDVATLSNGDVVAVGQIGQAATFYRYASATGDILRGSTLAGGSASNPQGAAWSVVVNPSDRVFVAAAQKYDDNARRQYVTLELNPDTMQPDGTGFFARYVDQGDPINEMVLLAPDGVYTLGTTNPGTIPDPMFLRILKYVKAASLASAKLFDLNGDGSGDLVVRHADGSIEVRLMQGTTVIGSSTFMPSAAGHIVTTTGDFNGDGRSDLLYARDDGAVEMWLMDGTSLTSIATIMPAGTGWSVAHVGDFNGDGKSDILWRNASGAVGLWLMDGSTASSRASLMAAGSSWVPELVGDFNADGNSDIVWRNSDGTVSMWLMNGTAIVDRGALLGPGNAYSPIQAGDFNHDGKTDLLLQATDGSVQMWLMDGRSSTATSTLMGANTNWTVTQVADFNGDGNSDLIWTGRDGSVGMWLMNGTALLEKKSEMGPGSGWSVSVAEDLNGDLRSDLVWSSTSGAVGAWLMNGTSIDSRAPLEPAGSTHRVVPLQFQQ